MSLPLCAALVVAAVVAFAAPARASADAVPLQQAGTGCTLVSASLGPFDVDAAGLVLVHVDPIAFDVRIDGLVGGLICPLLGGERATLSPLTSRTRSVDIATSIFRFRGVVMRGKRLAAAAAIVCLATFVAVVVGRGSGPRVATASKAAAKSAPAWTRGRELQRGGEESEDTAAAELYASRAYPADEITWDQRQTAMAAAAKVKARGAKLSPKWDAVGPTTLDVDRLGTQTFQRGTQWSGRITAMAVAPTCKPQECTLYVGAAGGGIWRSTNALAPRPGWKFISDDIPSNAIGSIVVDPNDATGKTIYAGTGEANGGDSEAGVGLYRTTDGGSHWSLVPGSLAIAANRGIPGLAIEPGNPSHILIGTGNSALGRGANGGGSAVPGAPAIGLYESRDGGATFTLSRTGTAHEIRFDPSDSSVAYAVFAGAGLWRSESGGAPASWQQIFQGTRVRYTFSAVRQADGKTRIYLGDSAGGGSRSQVYRSDDARAPAAAMVAAGNASWKRLSSPVDGTPGFASYGYCDNPQGNQCSYDMFVSSPADRPDMVVIGGLMWYDELPPYGTNGPGRTDDRSEGRAVLLSTDGGETWTDQTGDAQSPGESMHPDEHAIAFVPGNPDVMFVGSDGGVIRTNGSYSDISSQCDERGLSPLFLFDCHAWLKRVPTRLEPMNAGLATLQFQSIAVNPHDPVNEALGGTQDNGTPSYHGSPNWFLGLTGDGGDAGFDPVDGNRRFHSYFSGWIDVNYEGDNPESWLWISDPQFFAGGFAFYSPMVMDPVREKTIFIGGTRLWRTQDMGGDRAFLEAHCNTAPAFGTSDGLFTGVCGDTAPVGPASTFGSAFFGTGKTGGNASSIGRGLDDGTLWIATSAGRVFVSQNANAPGPSVSYKRIDTDAQPNRFVSSTTVDTANPNHAIVTFSGYGSNTPAARGHVFDVTYDPAAGTASWKDLSYDLGDMPVTDSAYDPVSGDVFVSTDFGVYRLARGTTTWTTAADGLPRVAVYSLTLAAAKQDGSRLLWAATHGRGAYRIRIG